VTGGVIHFAGLFTPSLRQISVAEIDPSLNLCSLPNELVFAFFLHFIHTLTTSSRNINTLHRNNKMAARFLDMALDDVAKSRAAENRSPHRRGGGRGAGPTGRDSPSRSNRSSPYSVRDCQLCRLEPGYVATDMEVILNLTLSYPVLARQQRQQ
jgi:hypothetical protein